MSLVFDRTATDYQRYLTLKEKALNNGWSGLTSAEQAEWNAGMKGAYNASDLNRVGAEVQTIKDALASYGISIDAYPHTNWVVNAQTLPSTAALERYRQDIIAVRNAIPVQPSTPNVPATMSNLTYTGANNIEKILYDVENLIASIALNEKYTGETDLQCGGSLT